MADRLETFVGLVSGNSADQDRFVALAKSGGKFTFSAWKGLSKSTRQTVAKFCETRKITLSSLILAKSAKTGGDGLLPQLSAKSQVLAKALVEARNALNSQLVAEKSPVRAHSYLHNDSDGQE